MIDPIVFFDWNNKTKLTRASFSLEFSWEKVKFIMQSVNVIMLYSYDYKVLSP